MQIKYLIKVNIMKILGNLLLPVKLKTLAKFLKRIIMMAL